MDADIAKIKEEMLKNWESIAPVIARQAPTASATAQELSWDRTVGKNAVSATRKYDNASAQSGEPSRELAKLKTLPQN